MPLPNALDKGVFINTESPLVKTAFIQDLTDVTGNIPPPESDPRITNNNDFRETNDGNLRVTNF